MLLNGSELCQLNLERVFSLGSCYGNCATGLFDFYGRHWITVSGTGHVMWHYWIILGKKTTIKLRVEWCFKAFSSQGKTGNFEQTGKVREFHTNVIYNFFF